MEKEFKSLEFTTKPDIDLTDKFKTQYSVSGSCEFELGSKEEAKEFIDNFFDYDPEPLSKESLEEYIKNNNVPKGCCVCATEDGGIAIDKGDADEFEFSKFADKLYCHHRGYYSGVEDIKELCNGNYIKVEK